MSNKQAIIEVVEILKNIEENVNELHKCSSDDFIMLNSYLKKQYNQIETISENVMNVFELTAGNENKLIVDKLNNFSNFFELKVKTTEKSFLQNIGALDKILSDINLMYIPVKNFVQNIVTLNFLTNSLKFNIVYFDKKNNKLLDEEIESFRMQILDLKKISSAIEEAGIQIKSSGGMIFSGTRNVKENNKENADKISQRIISTTSTLFKKNEEGKQRIPGLKIKQESYAESISKIIMNLQYSDIIRQKIEHIQEAHHDMIKKLKTLKDDDKKGFEKHMIQIKDIADLQIAQLVRTNKEYQNAVEIISSKFVEIANEINALTKDVIRFSGHSLITERVHTDFYQIEGELNEILGYTNTYVVENTDLVQEGGNIMPQMKVLESNFVKLKTISGGIEKLVERLTSKTQSLIEKGYDLHDIMQQIKNVYDSAMLNMNNVCKYFDQCLSNKTELNFDILDRSETSLSETSYQIKKILDETSKNNGIISKILVETENLENKVSSEIKEAIRQIKYYDFYEKMAEEIIVKLKQLYDQIDFESSSDSAEDREENLKENKERYTMKSERVTHNEVVSGENHNNSLNEEEEEIEFF